MDTFVEKEQLKALVREAIISVLEDDVYRRPVMPRARRVFASGRCPPAGYQGARPRRWQKA